MKRIICLLISAIMISALLTSCGTEEETMENNKTAKLTVWGSSDDQDMLSEMADDFKDAYENIKADISIKVNGEDVAKDEALKDIDAAADVFAIGHDQLGSLVEAGAIYEITGEYKERIEAANSKNSVSAATYNGSIYGFPSSAETYLLYYDSSKLNKTDVESLNTIMSKDLKDTAPFGINLQEGYYGSSFFLTAGCTLFGASGEDATQCDFNNANGLKAAKFISTLKSKGVVNCDENEAVSQMKSGKLASYVTGPWKAQAMKEALGDNFAVAKLPTVALAEGDEQQQLISFGGYKLYVVNAKTKNPEEAMKLAEHLTNEANQIKRFETRDAIPVNENAAKDENITKNETIAAALEQLEFARPMPAITQISVYWTAFKSFAVDCYNGNIKENELQPKLDNMVKQITAS
jgi:arabinogalactan oligomer/maltooligosaccharide transport system substrate-binding protein